MGPPGRQQAPKSETREMVEREQNELRRRAFTAPAEWTMRSSTFFIAFVVIAAGITIAALVLR
ncbi:MAG: hypothetical protein NT062_00205 [Proteobacteria bacterium]|nr:hypothetical protein [Pseudomonadota bacterium]